MWIIQHLSILEENTEKNTHIVQMYGLNQENWQKVPRNIPKQIMSPQSELLNTRGVKDTRKLVFPTGTADP